MTHIPALTLLPLSTHHMLTAITQTVQSKVSPNICNKYYSLIPIHFLVHSKCEIKEMRMAYYRSGIWTLQRQSLVLYKLQLGIVSSIFVGTFLFEANRAELSQKGGPFLWCSHLYFILQE